MSVVKTQLYMEKDTKQPCRSCKWEIADPTNPDQGQCTVNRTSAGAVWKRWVRDVHNMTCSRHEKGKLSFREHV